ncbi:unnamed protein product [Hymenolepis diminuta]|uniref:HYLS1_C domain-containing protein n=1 Tax=Hymenolepis diminuta TaxID=6216 RepID=A0A158QBQ6_HYMDI|nr:unnamed protein product [Hymenolepis diminuta]
MSYTPGSKFLGKYVPDGYLTKNQVVNRYSRSRPRYCHSQNSKQVSAFSQSYQLGPRLGSLDSGSSASSSRSASTERSYQSAARTGPGNSSFHGGKSPQRRRTPPRYTSPNFSVDKMLASSPYMKQGHPGVYSSSLAPHSTSRSSSSSSLTSSDSRSSSSNSFTSTSSSSSTSIITSSSSGSTAPRKKQLRGHHKSHDNGNVPEKSKREASKSKTSKTQPNQRAKFAKVAPNFPMKNVTPKSKITKEVPPNEKWRIDKVNKWKDTKIPRFPL